MPRTRIGLGLILVLLAAPQLQAQRAVKITSPDGFALHANYYRSQTPGPGVLLLHQCDREGPLSGFEGLGQALMDLGFHVLIPDYRTYGQSVDDTFSAGAWRLAGPHTANDLEAVYQFLIAQPGVDANSIGMAGASCGGRHAIRLASQHPQVKTLVFLSSQVGPGVFPTYQTLAHLPVLSIVSEEDPFGRTTATMEAVFEASAHPDSRLVLYKGNAHGTPLFAQDPSLLHSVAAWFQQQLRP